MKNKKGFTFIETLIVIAIIAIMATAVVVAVNPARRFEDARDKQREIHLQTIYNAIERKTTIEAGWFDEEKCTPLPQGDEGIDEETGLIKPIFKTIGNKRDDNDPEKLDPNFYDLFDCLVPKYMVNELYDPDGGSATNTHYQIWQNPQTKYVTLRYVKDDPYKEIVAGAKKYAVLRPPTVTTASTTKITHISAESGGNVTDNGGASVFERGVVWHTQINPTYNNNLGRTADGSGRGEFESTITGLTSNTTYYVRAYARNDIGIGYDEEPGVSFSTPDLRPVVRTLAAEHVTNETADLQGEILTTPIKPVYGYFCWGESEFGDDECPKKTSEQKFLEKENIYFSALLTDVGLEVGKTYYFRACGRHDKFPDPRCDEGSEGLKSFTPDYSLPHVETRDDLTDDFVPASSAYLWGEVVSDGGSALLKRGICFSQAVDPLYESWNDNLVFCREEAPPLEIGTFSIHLDDNDLEVNTDYSFRAYAENEDMGLSQGYREYFTTEPSVPVVTTKTVIKIKHSSAESGGEVTFDGGATVTKWGVCWELSANGDPEDTVNPEDSPLNCTINDPPGWENFTSPISVYSGGLWGGKNYNVQVYAINSKGTGWGDPKLFTTDPPVEPTLTTKQPYDLGSESAKSGGDLTDHGGSSIIALGVCWVEGSLDVQPELTYETASSCPGVTPVNKGSFSITIQNLLPGRTYWVRAFAKNRDVSYYGYGNLWSFTTTPPVPPTVNTIEVTDAGTNWVKIKGKVTDDGGDTSTKRGICYGTYNLPTFDYWGDKGGCLYDDFGTGEGNFEITIGGLEAGVQYYGRVFAENPAGRRYDDDAEPSIPFSTAQPNGFTCTNNSQCESHICNREGICCGTPCDQLCWSCAIEPNVGTCTKIPTGQDPRNECQESWTSCNGQCARTGQPGYCDASTGECKAATPNVPIDSGYICTGNGVKTPVSTTPGIFCYTQDICTAGSCSGTRYYTSCNGTGSCRSATDHTDSTSTPIFAQVGKVLTSTCGNQDSTASIKCGDMVCVRSNNNCSGQKRYPECNSSGVCDSSATSYYTYDSVNATANKILTTSCIDSSSDSTCNTCQWCQGGSCESQFKDIRDNNIYSTIQIGPQCWMKQNMNIGTRINSAYEQGTTCPSASDIEKYCWNDGDAYCNYINPSYPDGGLYQWLQVMCGYTTEGAQGICPDGWHIPRNSEWGVLIDYVVGGCGKSMSYGSDLCSPAGTYLKPGGSSGFNANLAGVVWESGAYRYRGEEGNYWSSTMYSTDSSYRRSFDVDSSGVDNLPLSRNQAASVRCIKN